MPAPLESDETTAELVEKYGIRQAPTLINIVDGKVEKVVNLSNIKAFSERNA